MKPTYQEWIVITAMIFGVLGFVLGSQTAECRHLYPYTAEDVEELMELLQNVKD